MAETTREQVKRLFDEMNTALAEHTEYEKQWPTLAKHALDRAAAIATELKPLLPRVIAPEGDQ